MTEITIADLKILYFSLIFMGIVSVFVVLFALQPQEQITPPVSKSAVETSQANQTSVSSPSWIGKILNIPQPFSDLAIVLAVFVTPVIIMVAVVSIRYIKDLATQWV